MLKVGDHVVIDGGPETGVVKQVHPHEAVVKIADGSEQRYALESLRRDPTLDEISEYRDH
jgi:preprotein translocase subunit YajC